MDAFCTHFARHDVTSYETPNGKKFNRTCPRHAVHGKLAAFIKYLEREGLVEFDIRGSGDRHFYNRFKIQKYAFLSNLFGMEFPYKHGIYMYGPYSRSLRRDYYDLAENPDEYASESDSLPPGFRQDEFMDLVRGRDNDWLEIASTLISKREDIPARRDLIENTEATKVGFAIEYIENTLEDLERKDLIKCDL